MPRSLSLRGLRPEIKFPNEPTWNGILIFTGMGAIVLAAIGITVVMYWAP